MWGYAGTVTLSCGTLPANMQCSFFPATLTADGNNDVVQSTLAVLTTGPAKSSSSVAGSTRRNGSMKVLAFLFFPSGLLLWGFAGKRKQLGRYLPLLALALFGAGFSVLSGCSNAQTISYAAQGISQVTVTAVGSTGGQSQTVNLAISIQ
jgi:hypothetical protein